MRLIPLAAAAVLTLAALPTLTSPALAQTVEHVRGTIKSFSDHTLVIDTREGGTATITLAPKFSVGAVVPATMADAKKGAYIGAAAVGPKDNLRATEVLIFPPAAKGAGEGHYPWDLGPGVSMTNGTVDAEVTGTDGRELTVVAKGETLKIDVRPGTPIVAFAPGSAAMLTPGTHVFIGAKKAADGTLTAARVNAGKDGLTPPM